MLPTQFTRMHLIAPIVFSLLLTACGGGGGNSSGTGGAPAQTSFTIGGTVSGLNGTVVLQNNSGNDLTLTANGTFKFSTALSSGTAYAVTVKTAPASVIAQTCVVTNGNGIVSTVNVTNVVVTCTDVPPVAPAVTVTYGVKQVILSWTAVSGATYYQVSKRSGSATAYTQLGSNLTTVSYADTVAVHLTDWINVSYIVAACNTGGCTNSAAINAFDAKQAIGYFKASNTGSNDNFGNSVALSADGNTMAVGAVNESSNATGVDGIQSDNSKPASGAVYVFTRNAGSWSQQAYIKPTNTDADDCFGYAVALSADGNTLAVGAYQESSNATGINGLQSDNSKSSSGAVYIFTRSANSWTQQAYVKASNTDTSDDFGFSVALSTDGNIMAVGAPLEASNAKGINGDQSDNSKSKSGAVYVFTRSSNTWTQQAYI
ncbi:MAG TPA: FG-GAP repeat protein, partial [Steroidobacteraceae bacterium]|nr:FG-GAP repeat protein [Steroidobacteraceae bacterium]